MIFSAPELDVEEDEKGYTITLDIAEFDKDSVKATLRNGVLTVTAQYRAEEERTESGVTMKSQRFGTFMRSMPIPGDANLKSFTSSVKDDMLNIRIGKKK
jgi:HSP20 family protein